MSSESPARTVDGSEIQLGLISWVVFPLAVFLGLLVAAFDIVAPFGDDTEKGTIVLLAASGGLLGFLQPRRPWRWGTTTGVWMPLSHGLFYLLGWGHAINPNTFPAYVLLLAVSVAICTGGGYAGSLLRKAINQAAKSD
jgi:hypothetical protein